MAAWETERKFCEVSNRYDRLHLHQWALRRHQHHASRPLDCHTPLDIFFIMNTIRNSQPHAISLITVVKNLGACFIILARRRRLPLSAWDGSQPIRLGIVDSEGFRENMIYEVTAFLVFWKYHSRTSIFDSSLIPALTHSLPLFSALVAIL